MMRPQVNDVKQILLGRLPKRGIITIFSLIFTLLIKFKYKCHVNRVISSLVCNPETLVSEKNQWCLEDELFTLTWMMRRQANGDKQTLFGRQTKGGIITVF